MIADNVKTEPVVLNTISVNIPGIAWFLSCVAMTWYFRLI